MPLPILTTRSQPSDADLVRLYHRTSLHWAQQLSDGEELEVGTAFAHGEFRREYDANQIVAAALPAGMTPAQAVGHVEAHYAARNSRCLRWVPNPGLDHASLGEQLLSIGYKSGECDILHLAGSPRAPIAEVPGLTIIPARASFRHAQFLLDELAEEWASPDISKSMMLHLEDPHTDALLALQQSEPVALIALNIVGEIGCIEQVFVSTKHRNQGIGRTMMSRVLEICARSLLRHVFIGANDGNDSAHTLYRKCNFAKVGRYRDYYLPKDAF